MQIWILQSKSAIQIILLLGDLNVDFGITNGKKLLQLCAFHNVLCHSKVLTRITSESIGLCCLMTPGLSKDIQCHVWPYFF